MMKKCRLRLRGEGIDRNKMECHLEGLREVIGRRERRGDSKLRVMKRVRIVKRKTATKKRVRTVKTARRSLRGPRNLRERIRNRRNSPATGAHLLEYIPVNLKMMG